ncbi:ADP-ribose pyrophosphatase YjhB, NUDIX family [Paenibacillus sp. UNCCL117]|uniref:NUDIX hydrolase n=1 Tax=unclassified Paenibacillus TaxID=185978 RepID=UPI0008831A9E|nr:MULTISPECIES: NUDIX hydrolase [unclassified Paenibacillus]SDE43964.1 ADP-ribose pyrophosphatase YjhB, NUDIX family [Paenibacillus sp. cl123]SFW46125.1 ADP-ribose pyrophosphatase YjhB, NUDIX family [Paenibacillus sp. UNCCL117]
MTTSPKHTVTAAAVVLNKNNEILLINGPKRGWEIPGGRVEEGESLSSAVIRETKEETGIDIEIMKFCGMFQNVKDSVCNTLFLGRPVGGEFRTSSDSLEIGFFTIEEALQKITWKSFREQIEYCMEYKEQFLVEFNKHHSMRRTFSGGIEEGPDFI